MESYNIFLKKNPRLKKIFKKINVDQYKYSSKLQIDLLVLEKNSKSTHWPIGP